MTDTRIEILEMQRQWDFEEEARLKEEADECLD